VDFVYAEGAVQPPASRYGSPVLTSLQNYAFFPLIEKRDELKPLRNAG
jgi:hypothetical protein